MLTDSRFGCQVSQDVNKHALLRALGQRYFITLLNCSAKVTELAQSMTQRTRRRRIFAFTTARFRDYERGKRACLRCGEKSY